jgi:hypothetical protein
MSSLVEGFLHLMALVFERQRWYFVVLHAFLLLLMIGFSLIIAIVVSKLFGRLDGSAMSLVLTVLMSFMFAAALAALWWVFVALVKKTASK